jgi:hypothetical protein
MGRLLNSAISLPDLSGLNSSAEGGRTVATSDQMKALVRSHADGDNPQFYAVAMQVAAKAARSGQSKFAQELRNLVDEFFWRYEKDF